MQMHAKGLQQSPLNPARGFVKSMNSLGNSQTYGESVHFLRPWQCDIFQVKPTERARPA